LPQDRVSEFAKLSPIQLLDETEKAVGDPDLPVQHRQLVERSKELKALEVVMTNLAPIIFFVRLRVLSSPDFFRNSLLGVKSTLSIYHLCSAQF
jgi:hypothetical protein